MAVPPTPAFLAMEERIKAKKAAEAQAQAPQANTPTVAPSPESLEQAKVLAGDEKAGTASRVIQGLMSGDVAKAAGFHPGDVVTKLTGSDRLGWLVGEGYEIGSRLNPTAIVANIPEAFGLIGDATVRREGEQKRLSAPEYAVKLDGLKQRLEQAAGKPMSLQITDTGSRDGVNLDKARNELFNVYMEREAKRTTPEEQKDPDRVRAIKLDAAKWALDTAKSAVQAERLPYTMVGEDNWTDSIMELPWFTRMWAAHFLPKSYVHEDGSISEEGIGLRGGSAVLDYLGNVLSVSDIVSSVVSDKVAGTGGFKAPWSREAVEEIRSGKTLIDSTGDVYKRAGEGKTGVAAGAGWVVLSLAVEMLDPIGAALKGGKMATKAGVSAIEFSKLAKRGEKIADAFEVAKPQTFTELKKVLKNDLPAQFFLSRSIAKRIGDIPELREYAEHTGKNLESILDSSQRGLEAGLPDLEKALKAALTESVVPDGKSANAISLPLRKKAASAVLEQIPVIMQEEVTVLKEGLRLLPEAIKEGAKRGKMRVPIEIIDQAIVEGAFDGKKFDELLNAKYGDTYKRFLENGGASADFIKKLEGIKGGINNTTRAAAQEGLANLQKFYTDEAVAGLIETGKDARYGVGYRNMLMDPTIPHKDQGLDAIILRWYGKQFGRWMDPDKQRLGEMSKAFAQATRAADSQSAHRLAHISEKIQGKKLEEAAEILHAEGWFADTVQGLGRNIARMKEDIDAVALEKGIKPVYTDALLENIPGLKALVRAAWPGGPTGTSDDQALGVANSIINWVEGAAKKPEKISPADFIKMAQKTTGHFAGGADPRDARILGILTQLSAQLPTMETAVQKYVVARGLGMTKIQADAVNGFIKGDLQKMEVSAAETLQLLNKLGMPISQKSVASIEGISQRSKMLRQYNGVFVPGSVIDELAKNIGAVTKDIEAFSLDVKNPWYKKASQIGADLMRLQRRSMLTGIALPRPRYWVNQLADGFASVWQEEGLKEAIRTTRKSLIYNVPMIRRKMPWFQKSGLDIAQAMAEKAQGRPVLNSMVKAFYDPVTSAVFSERDNVIHVAADGAKYSNKFLREYMIDAGVLSSQMSEDMQQILKKNLKGTSFESIIENSWKPFAEHADFAQQRQRADFFLHLVLDKAVPIEEAATRTLNSFYDWSHGIAKIDTAAMAFFFQFHRAIRLGAWQSMRALGEGLEDRPDLIGKPLSAFVEGATGGQTRLGRLSQQYQTIQASREVGEEAMPEGIEDPDMMSPRDKKHWYSSRLPPDFINAVTGMVSSGKDRYGEGKDGKPLFYSGLRLNTLDSLNLVAMPAVFVGAIALAADKNFELDWPGLVEVVANPLKDALSAPIQIFGDPIQKFVAEGEAALWNKNKGGVKLRDNEVEIFMTLQKAGLLETLGMDITQWEQNPDEYYAPFMTTWMARQLPFIFNQLPQYMNSFKKNPYIQDELSDPTNVDKDMVNAGMFMLGSLSGLITTTNVDSGKEIGFNQRKVKEILSTKKLIKKPEDKKKK